MSNRASPKSDARERLIDGTRELLWDRGYVGTSPTAILERSGVGQGSMYHHFRGKPDLILAAEERTASEMREQIREVFSQETSAVERITEYLTRERDALRGCSVGRLTADPEIISDERLREPVRATFAVLHECLSRAVREGQDSGELSPAIDPDEVASALSAVIQGGYVLARAEQAVAPFDRAIRGALALLKAATG